MIDKDKILDLKTIACPLNVVQCKLALEKIPKGETLFVELDKGEPEMMVKQTLIQMGYKLKTVEDDENWVRFAISYESN